MRTLRTALDARGVAVAAATAFLLAACTGGGGHDPPPTSPATASTPSGRSSASSPALPAAAPADWPTYHRTADRAGIANLPIGPLIVAARLRLDAAVYASPLVVGGLVIAATENNTVYAFDGAYHQVWRTHLGTPASLGELPCGNIDPLGITGTPVYDHSTGLLFVAVEQGGPPRHTLVALDPRTGAVRRQMPLDLPGVENAAMQQRGALTVAGGRVWVAFGGLAGDCGGYKGRVVGLALDGSATPIAYTVPTPREGGIWAPPGPAVDAAGRLLVAVGNGESGPGDPYDHSDSILAIDTNARLVDSFSPTTWATDNAADLDLGSQGPALVGRWVFIAGKSGTAYVLRLDELGGIGGEVSHAAVCRSFGGTAVLGDTVFVPCDDGVRAVRIDSSGTMHVLWHAAENVAGSPIVGGGQVWTLDAAGGRLHALELGRGADTASADVGPTSRFATPAVRGADVLVPTLAGVTVVRVG